MAEFSLTIKFEDLRIFSLESKMDFNSAYAGADMSMLECTMQYAHFLMDCAVFVFDGLPSGFIDENEFGQAYCARIKDIAEPFAASFTKGLT